MTEYTGSGWTIRSGKWEQSPPDEVDHCITDAPFTKHVSAKAKQREGLYSRQAGKFTGDRPGMWGESLAIMHAPGKKRWNRGGHAGRWDGGRRNHGQPFDEHCHETQKPLWLMVELIEAFTDPGELVWDPFTGGGTTGVACLLTGRRFLGHEMQDGDPWPNDYVSVTVERLRAAEHGQALGEFRAGQIGLFA